MSTPFDQLLKALQVADGDPARLALATFDFAVADDPALREVAEVAAIPHWFTATTLAALLPDRAGEMERLVDSLSRLPMVESYGGAEGEPAWNVHDATRLALRDRLLSTDPERFRELSGLAALTYWSPDPIASDSMLTCEHLYHQLAQGNPSGDDTFLVVVNEWLHSSRHEPLQILARFLEELLSISPQSPVSPRIHGWACLTIADTRFDHQESSKTLEWILKAERIFREAVARDAVNTDYHHGLFVSLERLGRLTIKRGDPDSSLKHFSECQAILESLTVSEPDNRVWQRELSVSLNWLGNLTYAQGDWTNAFRYYTESLAIVERLAASAPDDDGAQRDLSVSLFKLGGLAEDQDDAPAALEYLTRSLTIAKNLAKKDPSNNERQRDISVSLARLGNLAVARGDLPGALRYLTESRAIDERLTANDPDNTQWQHDLMYSCATLATKIHIPQDQWPEALPLMERALTISEKLAAYDPSNVIWQDDARAIRRDLAIIREHLAASPENHPGSNR
jgi:tetratricopeptide (TPR) repeat protein